MKTSVFSVSLWWKTVWLLLLCGTLADRAFAQALWHKGATEIGFIAGGGPSITGGVGDRGFLLAGLRWGRQIFGDRDHVLEYAVEAMPLYLQFQSETVYGAAVNPVLLRYNFARNPRLAPFIEVGAGILGTTEQVPEGTSRFNFTPQGGVGVQYFARERLGWTLGLRYHHTSNAGIARFNPGINAIMIYTGLAWWR